MLGTLYHRLKPHTRLAFAVGVPVLLLLIPSSWYPIDDLTVIEHRVIAIFFFAAIFWVLEPIPIYATSILIIVFELILLSDNGLLPLRQNAGSPEFGTLLDYRDIMATFASPIILLFLGGFFLAMAATKFRLDQNLARVLLRPFGTKPSQVMLGLMGITAIFSMFMSNTATPAMMLSILMPVLQVFEPGDRGKLAFALSIPLAANIGGMGTPIGTPPNAIALKYLVGENAISFSEWMLFGVPYVLILLGIGWLLLLRLHPIQTPAIELQIKGTFLKNSKAVGIFLATNIITKEDLKRLSWDVLWLVSGGIALGLALEQSGLAQHIIESIPFGNFSPYIILSFSAILAVVMANFMSNTATANLLLPLMAALGTSISSLDVLGGAKAILLGVTLAASLGMALPISTPPNALAHATGEVQTGQLAQVGIIMAVIGLLLIFGLLFILKTVGFV